MQIITNTQVSHRHWWLLAIRGLLAVIFGLTAFLWPGVTLFVLVYLFGAYSLIDGVMAVTASLQGRGSQQRWWLLLEGLAGIAAGVLAFLWPGITALVLLYLIASWAIVTGIFEIIAAFSGGWRPEWTLALAGLISVLLGILLAVQPAVALLGLVWVIGIYAIIFGILLIIRAFRFRTASPALTQIAQ